MVAVKTVGTIVAGAGAFRRCDRPTSAAMWATTITAAIATARGDISGSRLGMSVRPEGGTVDMVTARVR
ncbi:hypothetical protein PanNE5_05080 [Pandoraea sp. NE5]|nr:hypothetical protein PanNE5_05080 [Pandoraea sp. NE5]